MNAATAWRHILRSNARYIGDYRYDPFMTTISIRRICCATRMWHRFEAYGPARLRPLGRLLDGAAPPGAAAVTGATSATASGIGRMLASGDLRLDRALLHRAAAAPRLRPDQGHRGQDRRHLRAEPRRRSIPPLTFLEEAGYVTSSAEGNKRLYTITDEGKAHLERQPRRGGNHARPSGPDRRAGRQRMRTALGRGRARLPRAPPAPTATWTMSSRR